MLYALRDKVHAHTDSKGGRSATATTFDLPGFGTALSMEEA